jgi:FtsZ-interacting cell division protein ZipA
VFEIDVKYIGDDVEFMFMNKNSMTDDENIGNLKMKMTACCANKGVDDWWAMQVKGKEVGKIHISTNWIPDDIVMAGSAKAAEPAAPAQPQVAQQPMQQMQQPQQQVVYQQPQQQVVYQQPQQQVVYQQPQQQVVYQQPQQQVVY